MSHFDSIYAAYIAAVIIVFVSYFTSVITLSDFTVFVIVESAVLWTIFRLLFMFLFSWDVTHLVAAILLVGLFGGIVYHLTPPFIRDIIGSFLKIPVLPSPKKVTLAETILKTGLPEDK
jgi:hypothetical protein